MRIASAFSWSGRPDRALHCSKCTGCIWSASCIHRHPDVRCPDFNTVIHPKQLCIKLASRPFCVVYGYFSDFSCAGRSDTENRHLWSFWGMLIGLLTGIPAGRSRKARYWIAPILRVLAPIPSVTWMALFFVLSKSLFQGCVAMVAYSVWYPVASGIMRGILQVDHAYIEAAQTLGASSEWKILRYVTLPSVLPCLFQGMISGMRAACGSLMIAEMMGVESGLAWYITWQRGWGNFTKMYTAIVMICITFLFVDAALGLLRRRILRWEENADA